MARFNPHHESKPVYKAVETWRERCLVNDGSLFLQDKQLWTKQIFDELDQ